MPPKPAAGSGHQRAKLLVAVVLAGLAVAVWFATLPGRSGPDADAGAAGSSSSTPGVSPSADEAGEAAPAVTPDASPGDLSTDDTAPDAGESGAASATAPPCSPDNWCRVVTELHADAGGVASLLGVGGTAADDLWISGYVDTGEGGPPGAALFHWDGAKLSEVATPTAEPLWAVAALSRTDAWIVGGEAILHWDGHAVRTVANPAGRNLLAIAALGPRRAWVGAGDMARILAWNGASWSVAFASTGPPLPAYTFDAIAARSENDAWAGGDGDALAHWDGRAWRAEPGLVSGMHVAGIWLDRNSADGWAVGHNGLSLRRAAGGWTPVPTGSAADLHGVWARAPNDAWAVGSDGVLHWDGRAWVRSDAGVDVLLHAVWGDARETWAVGDRGTVLRRTGAAPRVPSP